MSPILNIDLLSVAIATAANSILGFIAFFNNKHNISNRNFLFLTLAASSWSIVNYLSYQFNSPAIVIWLFRGILFFAVWYCFALFQFFYTFPDPAIKFPHWYRVFLIPAVIAVALFTFSPFVLEKIEAQNVIGQVS